MKAEKVEN